MEEDVNEPEAHAGETLGLGVVEIDGKALVNLVMISAQIGVPLTPAEARMLADGLRVGADKAEALQPRLDALKRRALNG